MAVAVGLAEPCPRQPPADEQRRGAVALVVVRHRPTAARLQRQPRLRPVQRLDRTLFVEAEHDRVPGGFGTGHVLELLLEARMLLTLKVRTKCGFSPHERHTRCTKLCVVPAARAIDRHDQCVASGGSVCVVSSLRASAPPAPSSTCRRGCRPEAAPSRSPPLPPPRTAASRSHLVLVGAQRFGDRLVRHPVRRHQHDPRPLLQPHRHAPRPRPPTQALPVCLRKLDLTATRIGSSLSSKCPMDRRYPVQAS